MTCGNEVENIVRQYKKAERSAKKRIRYIRRQLKPGEIRSLLDHVEMCRSAIQLAHNSGVFRSRLPQEYIHCGSFMRTVVLHALER